MTIIEAALLFTQKNKLLPEEQARVLDIIREEYCKVFYCDRNQVNVELLSGKSNGAGNDIDICLFIQEDTHYANAGKLRGEMRKEIANRLLLYLPVKNLGFRGFVNCKDGLLTRQSEDARKTGGEKSENARKTDGEKSEEKTEQPRESAQDYVERAKMYIAQPPKHNFAMLRIPEKTRMSIESALGRIEFEREIFEQWGLYAIMPNPASAMSFFGPPGTGKSLAAEAIANKLGKNLIRASYADIENKYVGEGPKNVKAIFLAAEQQDALLFIDEADSLLSKRLTNVGDGSAQAINSMRSQLLISLEQFHGIVIFATNLVVNYDRAFLSRLINIEFPLPDEALRKEIWEAHIYPQEGQFPRLNIPLAEDVDTAALARDYELCGRDIRNSVVNACVYTRQNQLAQVSQDCFRKGIELYLNQLDATSKATDHTTSQNGEPSNGQTPYGELKPTLQKVLKSREIPTVTQEELKREREESHE